MTLNVVRKMKFVHQNDKIVCTEALFLQNGC